MKPALIAVALIAAITLPTAFGAGPTVITVDCAGTCDSRSGGVSGMPSGWTRITP